MTPDNLPRTDLSHATMEELIVELSRRTRAVGGAALMAFDLPGKCLNLPGNGKCCHVGALTARLGMHEITRLLLAREVEMVVGNTIGRIVSDEQ